MGSDSNMIISQLTGQFNVSLDNELTGEQLALSQAATSMVENHTAQTGLHYRYGYNMPKFWTRFQPFSTRLRNHMAGLSRGGNPAVWALASKDLLALSTWLADKQYFHGSSPSSLDCTIFGHLAQFLYIDIGFPQKPFMESECRNLVDLLAR